MEEKKGRTTLGSDYPSFPQRSEQELEIWFLEETFCGSLWITRVCDYDVEFVLLVCQEFEPISYVYRDVGVLETNRHAGEVFFGEPNDGFVNVAQDGMFDGGVFDYLTEDAAIAAADDKDAFRVGMGIHRKVGYHFLVAKRYQ